MEDFRLEQLPDGSRQYRTSLRGISLLYHPTLNKGSAFTLKERDALGLTGLLPAKVSTLEGQVARVNEFMGRIESPITQYEMLMHLRSDNRTVYYATLASNLDRYLPIVYTPTVGEACEDFGHLAKRPNGMYIPITERHRIRELLGNWHTGDIRFAVVTDGSRILGLGDLGANGMGIPVGKLALYTAVAGVPPRLTMPITLDVGTDNAAFLSDPMYQGLQQPRVTGAEYDGFIEDFVTAFTETFPDACIQWEDFKITHAEPILRRYRDQICTFNDDIQGTAATAVAGLYAAARAKGESMADQRVLFFGAGSAGIGIADLFTRAVQAEGLSLTDARTRVQLFDKDGLLTAGRTNLADFQQPFCVDAEPTADLLTAIARFRPTAIIGVSTVAGAFTPDVLRLMAEINERPVIFPYSNPTSHSETTAEAAYAATEGRVLFASGSPFPQVLSQGKMITPSQGNNVYIFPALGLAVLAAKASRVTEQMFLVAAQTLASQVSDDELADGLLYPTRDRIREVSAAVAEAVAGEIFTSGLAREPRPADLAAHIRSLQYHPEYLPTLPEEFTHLSG